MDNEKTRSSASTHDHIEQGAAPPPVKEAPKKEISSGFCRLYPGKLANNKMVSLRVDRT